MRPEGIGRSGGIRKVMRGFEDERPRALRGLGKRFGDLKVRPKLMILHNVFFLVLAAALYFSPIERTRWALLAALGLTYLAAVLLLELLLMPLYVYRPLRLLLDADKATQRGDNTDELIDPRLITEDELGQIMRSRNTTITLLRQHEADLNRKNRLLEMAKQNLADQDRLVSLGMLSASVAHEFNTPLAVLHGSIEKLIETVPDPAAQERLARVVRVTDRLRKISASLLDFARPSRHEMGPVPIHHVIEEAWGLVGIDEKAASVHFTNEIPRGEMVVGNADRLVQVFVNLLRNALGAAKPSGMVCVRSERLTREGRDWITIIVDDNGPGIPASVLPKIFEAFVTSRLDARGTGLGLTVAEGIVHQHGGAIAAVNRPEGGARLEVRLPAHGIEEVDS